MNLPLLLAYAPLAGAGLIHLLIALLVLSLVIYVCYLILGMLPLPAPAKQIISIILAVVFLLLLLQQLGLFV